MKPMSEIAEQTLRKILNETAVDVIHCLNNTNPDAKEEFLRDSSLPKPHNQYGNLEIAQIRHNIRSIDKAQEILDSHASSAESACVYKGILQNNRQENQFILANDLYNHSAGGEERALAVEQHSRAAIALYGPVDPGIFWSILNQKLDAIRPDSLSREDRRLYDELIEKIGPVEKRACSLFAPREETLAAFASCMNSFFAGFLRHIPKQQQVFTAEEVCEITNEIIREEPKVLDRSWRAVVEPNRPTAETSTRERTILYPGKRSRGPYSQEDVRAIIVHELGVHALRSMPFASHPISALAYGLPGYAAFEEGLATAAAASVNGKFEYPGLLHYVSIGLAVLLKKNFREVFEIQVRLERLSGGGSPSQCFDSVQRAFRGTGELPNNKDLIYLNGNQLVWKFIESHINHPADLLHQLFEMGKSNPLDPTYAPLFSEFCKNSEFF